MNNNYQKSLDNIKYHVEFGDEIKQEDIDNLQELVDKSTPKKPKSVYPLDECVWNNLHCPNCDEKVGALYIRDKYRDYTRKINYCTECGQALDWSENGK